MSGTGGLSYGLNIRKAKKPDGLPKPKKPILGFAPEGDEAEGGDPEEEDDDSGVFGKGKGKGKAKTGKKPSKQKPNAVVNAQLATFAELSKKAEKAAADVDPSIYDYDGVWDSMKSVDRRKYEEEEADIVERKPKYMENLLSAAETRKRDMLRAKERMLQKEREAEGEEFADKETFVTDAYRKQQEEMQRLEEEEKLREESQRKKSQGMSSFYRNMLEKTESKHDAMIAAAETSTASTTKDPQPSASKPKEKSDLEVAQELSAKGKNVEINEEGQVVDKTQLLSGGLNLSDTKSSRASSNRGSSSAPRQQQNWRGGNKAQQDLRARQSKMLEEQLAQAQKRAFDEEKEAREELERQVKSRKTETDVKSAKERYLQRKREAEAAKAKQKDYEKQ
ncbi:hypothetical protein RUND412_006478 [Rhizina undulata]